MKQIAVKAINAGVILVGQQDLQQSHQHEYLRKGLPPEQLERLGEEITAKLSPYLGETPFKVCVGSYAVGYSDIGQLSNSDNILDNFSRICEQEFKSAQNFAVPKSLCKPVLLDSMQAQSPEASEELLCFIVPISVLLPLDCVDEVEETLYGILEELEQAPIEEDPWTVLHEKDLLNNWSNNQLTCCYARLWFFHEEEPYSCMKTVLASSQLALIHLLLTDQSIKDKSSLSLIGAIPVATDAQGGIRVGFCVPEVYCKGLHAQRIEEIEDLYCLWHADYCRVIEGLAALGLPFAAVQYDPWNSRCFRHDHLFTQEPVNDFMVVRHPSRYAQGEQVEAASEVMHCVHLNPETETVIGVVIAGLDENHDIVQRHVAYLINPFNPEHMKYLQDANSKNEEVDFSQQSDYMMLDPGTLGLAGPFLDETLSGAPANATLH